MVHLLLAITQNLPAKAAFSNVCHPPLDMMLQLLVMTHQRVWLHLQILFMIIRYVQSVLLIEKTWRLVVGIRLVVSVEKTYNHALFVVAI
uniref:Uncharacterized protein n=1 Tax=Rhizophora mucronata TaxID=61149 RepID=A0A2P2JBX0_RHIMU